MDNNYSLIRILNQEMIELCCFNNNYSCNCIYHYPICFTVHFSSVYRMFVLLSIFSGTDLLSTQHKLYLGKEIFKAHLSIKLEQNYIQE
uniref:Uncharacterized protein n=1 Tax=Thaumatella adunca TaxID=2006976 RepID=A0A1Z1MNP8_9FLOR|nr:hypothetical protein [Thaumatella adunca]ARW67405.1 hypothetical protein [Thaumatella adunca]